MRQGAIYDDPHDTAEVLALPRGRALKRDDLDAMPDDGHRYELIDGILIVSPAPRTAHQRAGCQRYWVVDPDEPSITAWTLADGRYQQTAHAAGEDSFTIAEPFALSIAPAELTR